MGTILAIDYGLKRIGIAISDSSRRFAFAHGVIQNKSFDYVFSCLKEIIQDKDIDLILVGIPYHINKKITNDKEKSSMILTISGFVKKLQKKLSISIETIDEKLSSFVALEKLKEAGLSAKEAKEYVDQESARLILEEYINYSGSLCKGGEANCERAT